MGLASFPLSQSFYQSVKSALVLEMIRSLCVVGRTLIKHCSLAPAPRWKSLGAGDLSLWGCSEENQWYPKSPRLHTEDKPPTSSPAFWLLSQPHPPSFIRAYLFIVESFSGNTCTWTIVTGKRKCRLWGKANNDFWWGFFPKSVIYCVTAEDVSRLHCTVRNGRVEKHEQE